MILELVSGKTAKSILISCGARLAVFDIQELREITAYDELEQDTLGDRKTALFLIMSDTDATFNFINHFWQFPAIVSKPHKFKVFVMSASAVFRRFLLDFNRIVGLKLDASWTRPFPDVHLATGG